jgi:hypothetical protein
MKVGDEVIFMGPLGNMKSQGIIYEPPNGWRGKISEKIDTFLYIDSWYRGNMFPFGLQIHNNRLDYELAFSGWTIFCSI